MGTMHKAHASQDAGVDLFWIPLGAGESTHLVAVSGRAYERMTAYRAHREPRALFHSALVITHRGTRYAIEMAPAWKRSGQDRGVVSTGPVGWRPLGGTRLFRYEVRRWAGGQVPDIAEAVDSPVNLATDPRLAHQLLGLVPHFPCLTWGRDEQRTGDMWNSNSLIAWLLASSGHDARFVQPPRGGRAPGWLAGLTAALPPEQRRPVTRAPHRATQLPHR